MPTINYEWISIAALLMVLQPYRARCTRSENDLMAGFVLPQTSDSQIVSLFIFERRSRTEVTQMTDEIKTGTVLIKEGALLPEGLVFESEPCVSAWRLVKDLNGYALDRKIHGAGWTFFFQAGEIKATVFGIDTQQMARRAVERILRDPRAEKSNSLEIARVTSVGSERFPGVRFLTVAANLRHIQESLFLFSAKGVREPGPNRTEWRPDQDAGLTSGNGLREETSRQRLAAVSNR